MLKNISYKDGSFVKKGINLKFKKAFKSDKEFYLYNVNGSIFSKKIKAKKAIYSTDKITLYNCEIKDKKRVLRRKKYILQLKKP